MVSRHVLFQKKLGKLTSLCFFPSTILSFNVYIFFTGFQSTDTPGEMILLLVGGIMSLLALMRFIQFMYTNDDHIHEWTAFGHKGLHSSCLGPLENLGV